MADLQDLSERQQAFLLVSALVEGEKAPALLAAVDESRSRGLGAVLENLLQQPKRNRDDEIHRHLARLGAEGKVNLWLHADGGWVVEALRNESALVWALVFRELPRAKIGRVLSELPKEMRKTIKAMAHHVPAKPIWAMIKRRIESRFPAVPREVWDHLGEFENFRQLNVDQFYQLMRELGISEMAIAFSQVDRAATRAILHRLGVDEAKELRSRIKRGGNYSKDQMREAQMNILSLEGDKVKTDELTLEIGFGVFSRAFGKEHEPFAPIFIYKLSPRYGYVLKRYLDLNIPRNNPEKARRVREHIANSLERIRPQFG
ncbi:MAG TPA: FliG C-terminal domain-containing protein [bacterium]|nr:FliG C-terminal domain-containing protein [bacterium]